MGHGLRTVIVLDDEKPIVDLAARVLHRDYDVQTATEGAVALELIKQSGPQTVLVTDILMPVMDGLEVIARARAIREQLPALVISAHYDASILLRCSTVGPLHFLRKPFTPAELRQAVDLMFQARDAQVSMKVPQGPRLT